MFLSLSFIVASTYLIAQNPIVTENALTGNPASEWDITNAGDLSIQGFATDISVNKGQTVRFKINVNGGSSYTIRIYRIGYYQGNGARLVANLGSFSGTVQPQPQTNTSTGLVDCSNWSESANWAVPSTAVSGIYIAKLTRSDNGGASHITFIVRDDAGNAPVLFKTSDATWQAYNAYGGNSLYVGVTSYPSGHAVKVSYNRPFITRNGGGGGGDLQDWFLSTEYPMIRFLERNGYHVSYTTDVDMERSSTPITPSTNKIFLSVGHDEYWSLGERTKIENARAAGVHLAFFSGNEVYWKTRWEDNYRTLVCYKEGTMGENASGAKSDPTNSWTGLWRNPAGAAYDAGRPENELTGQISWEGSTIGIQVPAAYKNLRFWRNTSVASLANNQTATFPTGTLGYEWNWEQYPDNYPPGRITLSSTTSNGRTHKLSLYRHASGALVFGAGTVQWTWGLDNVHDGDGGPASLPMQQATVNLFADMGVQPATLMSGLVAASASTDLTAPSIVISSPAHNASVAANSVVTVSGTASENGGGQLVGVEVSIDGGTTWKLATGTTNWTYSFTPTVAGTVSVRVRGFDDSGNMGVPGASGSSDHISLTVSGGGGGGTATSIFQPTDGPSDGPSNDGSALTLGMKFRSTQNGFITGIRFYKASGMTGTHTAILWSSTGTNLAQANFTGETSSGWQQVLFTTPVAITAGTTYMASYFSASGDYVVTEPFFTTARVNGNLRALASGEDGPNGMYRYNSTAAFPNTNFGTSNYWVDVVFTSSVGPDVTPPTVSSVTPTSNATGINIGTSVTATFNEAISSASVTTSTFQLRNPANNVITATVSTSGNQITLTPSAPLSPATVYTATITGGASGVKDAAGNALASNFSWSFTTADPDVTPPTVSSVSPLNGATGVSTVGVSIIANFSEAINASTVTTSTFQLRDAGNNIVAATVGASGTQITLTPSAALATSTVYTVTITGGSSGVKDLSGNALASNFSWSFATASPLGCPCSVFTPSSVPNSTDLHNDGSAVVVGMKFRANQNGFITGIRYYKVSGLSGTRIGNLWSSTGTNLGQATFTSETSSGWQQVLFTNPIAITSGTTYVATYHSSSGQYIVDDPFFNQAVTNGPLTALASGTDGPNGMYLYSSTPAFPTQNYQTSNYWVDVVFTTSAGPDLTPPTVTSVSPVNGGTNVNTSTTVVANFSEALNASTVTTSTVQLRDAGNNLVPATVTVSSNQVTLTPSAPLANSTVYTAIITGGASGVKDPAGNALASSFTWSFTTVGADITPPTVSTVSPTNGSTNINIATAVVANFSEAINVATATTSTVQLRNPANNLITATVNASGSQVTLTPSAPLATSTVYTVTITGGSSGVKDLVGNALANNFSWSFTTEAPDATPPTVSNVTPANGTIDVTTTTGLTATFNEAINPSTVTTANFQLRDAGNNIVTATVSGSGNQITLTPSVPLSNSVVYTATITGGASGVKDIAGNALANNFSWSFTTVGQFGCPCTIFTPTTTPSNTEINNDGSGVILGMKFRSSQNGYVTGVRFYKPSGYTGTHIGNLWNMAGTSLAQATFVDETASGWQQVSFTTPVAISANTTYVVSFHSSSGQYIVADPYFNQAVTNGPLTALASGTDGPNGVYRYSSSPAFPNLNYQTSNYWVDVVFTTSIGPDLTPPTVTGVSPLNAATNVSVTTAVTATFSEAMNVSTVNGSTFQLRDAGNNLVPAVVTISGNQATLTPMANLATSTVFTVTITGGSSGVKDLAGNGLASNYTWSFTTSINADNVPPTVSSVLPLSGATGINITSAVTANFSEAVDPATVTTTTFQLRNPSNNIIPATVSTSSSQITLTPSAQLAPSTVYTVTITGGANGVKDAVGNPLANNFTWSFTTASGTSACPCTVFGSSGPTPLRPFNDRQGIEAGMKFRTTQNGYITGIRYYKQGGTSGTHIGHLWSRTGTKLAEAIFFNESPSGWQQVMFATPVAVTSGTTYVASYFSSSGDYTNTEPAFNSAVTNGPLTALANGTDGPNGVYGYSETPVFPSNGAANVNYWVDVVFNTSVSTDITAPTILSVSPANNATGVKDNKAITVSFSEIMSASSINNSTFELRDAANALIPATIVLTDNLATLTPSAPLSYSAVYTAKIKGGAAGAKDFAGNSLANDLTWSFTVMAPPPPPPTEGPGGPILVVSNSTNPFSRYTVEILRAQGLNGFNAKDISQVNGGDLTNYDVVILGEMELTSEQTSMFTNWVNAGGTLIAFRPSTQLSSLLGITKVSGSLSNQYLLVNTSSGAGVGIVNQTIQFHGTADLYTLSGATSLATLYSSATTATSNPAVTTRNVGANGGRAIAFTYDLPRSIVYTRQGNPEWAGQKRDGTVGPIRSDDMFFGGSSTDWVNLNKVAIPQADEQQHLLTNIILQGNLHRKPLPRFWFLPSGHKAAIVMTGDDHANNGTIGRFNNYMALAPNTPQDVADWKAVRGTSYIYTGGQISNAQAMAFEAQGFELALHLDVHCFDYNASSIQKDWGNQASAFVTEYPGLSPLVTNRTHCLAWSDWASAAKMFAQNGVRMDVTYYYWPASWIQNRPGMFTGSGMPMRFADTDGSLIDCYQVATQMTDESSITYNTFTNSLLDKALGSEGYYGVFCANMHTDDPNSEGSDQIIASALARQVPVVSSKQMLTWLDGRNGTTFGEMTWNNGVLTFPVTAPAGARNLKGMLPRNSDNGQLLTITRDGTPVTFTLQTIKGMQYAFFDVAIGTATYVATYSTPFTAPVVSTQPAAQTVCEGTIVNFTSVATGSPTPTMQWQESANGSEWTNIDGATTSPLTVNATAENAGKQYRAVWTNSQGTVNSNAALLTVNAIPAAPVVNVVDNCGNSVLTATNVTGTLLWSTGATSASINVTTGGIYTVTQTLNGCTSPEGSGTAAPVVSTVPAPTVSVENNCGNSVLTANGVTGSLLWSNGATTPSITVSNAATYTVTQTVDGCTSPEGSGTSLPVSTPATPSVNVVNNCGSSLLTATNVTGTLLWSTGEASSSITVTNAATYTVTQTVNGCTSAAGSSIAAPKSTPSAPMIAVVNNCGNSVLTAGNFTGSLLWSNGATTTSITVNNAATYTLTQTVNGCTSSAASAPSAPLTIPPVPTISVSGATTFCTGGSVTLTSSSASGNLWSNGATTQSIVVSTAGSYTVTVNNGSCSSTSAARVITVNPLPSLTSALTRTVTSATAFTYTPTSSISGTTFTWSRAAVTGISNAAANGTGSINETLTNTTGSSINVTYVYTLTANGCSSTQSVVVTVSNPAILCSVTSSRSADFNNTSIPAPRYIWFNSSFDPSSLGTTGIVNFYITNARVTFTVSGQQRTLNMPNSHIRFAAGVSQATTTFLNGVWETQAPINLSGYIFMGGLAYQVPSNLPGSINNVTWTATISCDRNNVSATWRWSAAVYTSFAAHASLQIKPKDGTGQNPYNNSDNAGAPQNFKSSLVSGARGTGGTNYTGSYSSTTNANCNGNPLSGLLGGILGGLGLESRQTGELTLTEEPTELGVEVMPNPASTSFNLVVRSDDATPVTIRIVNVYGQVLQRHEKVVPGTVFKVGQTLKSGTYYAEVIQGGRQKIVKLIKIN